jgi:hypothetical protein
MKREERILCPNFVYLATHWQNYSHLDTPSAVQKESVAFEKASLHTQKGFRT